MLCSLLSGCPMEERLIFHPEPEILRTPRDVSLSFDEVYFTSRDGVRLHGWFVPYPGAQWTLLWFHGNAGNIGHRLENLKLLHDKVQISVLLFDYRGFGRSAGKVSEHGTYLDGYAAIELLCKRYGLATSRLVLFGRSLGAAVAAEMAGHMESLLLILESPFVSVPAMARAFLPLGPLSALLVTQYNTLEKVRRITSPLLVLHGNRDEVVPYSQGREVFEAAPEPKRFYAIPGAGHNDTYSIGGDSYFSALRESIDWAAWLRRERTRSGGEVPNPNARVLLRKDCSAADGVSAAQVLVDHSLSVEK